MTNKMQTSFKVISWNEALKLIYETGREFGNPSNIVTIDDCVRVFVYFGDTAIVIPEYPKGFLNRNRYPAFIFLDKEMLKNCIKSKQFPVPKEFKSILEREPDLIDIVNTKNNYFAYLDNIISSNFENDIDLTSLEKGFKELKKFKEDSNFDKLILAYSIVVSEFLVNEYDGTYFVKKICSGYKPSYEVTVQILEKEICVFHCLTSEELNAPFEDFYQKIIKYLTFNDFLSLWERFKPL